MYVLCAWTLLDMGCMHTPVLDGILGLLLVSDWVDSRVSICICCWDVVIGAEWHASLPSDENHFMKRDLPRFLHNLYDDCRGPPRLFLLDKYGPLNPFDKSSSFKAFMLFSLKRSDSYTD
jgi:hypothetical protein